MSNRTRYFRIFNKALYNDKSVDCGIWPEEHAVTKKAKKMDRCIVMEVDTHKVSSCCGAEPRVVGGDASTEDYSICPQCNQHCTYETEPIEPLNRQL